MADDMKPAQYDFTNKTLFLTGAAGTIGAEYVARASADGYTLLWGTPGTHGIAPSIYARLPYDPLRDFAPVTLIALGTNLLVAHPSVPARSVREFIALATSRPGKLNFGSSGNGATSHMAGEMLKVMAAIDMLHVPFKGAAPAIVALLGGEVDIAILDTPPLLPHIRSGKLRVLAAASEIVGAVAPQLFEERRAEMERRQRRAERGWRFWRPTPWRLRCWQRPVNWARILRSARRNALACRWASVGRMPLIWPCAIR